MTRAYHEPSQVEPTIGDIDTHERLVGRTVRSLMPADVIQDQGTDTRGSTDRGDRIGIVAAEWACLTGGGVFARFQPPWAS